MAAILQTTFSNAFSWLEKSYFDSYFSEVCLYLFCPIDEKSSLVQVMAWHLFGAKPLPEPMMTRFIDA